MRTPQLFLAALLLTGIVGVALAEDPPAYTQADAANGGRLYDTFWAAETDFDRDDENLANYEAFSNFFRCKQCHGWDRMGNEGAYINRAPKASRPNVSGLDLRELCSTYDAQEMFDAIKSSAGRRSPAADLSGYDPQTNAEVGDRMPDYSQILSDTQIWDLVKFLREDAMDVDLLYDFTTTGAYPDGSIAFTNLGKNGDAARGDAIFASRCADCHGDDGAMIEVDGGYTVGSHLRAKPNEDHHKMKYGQLGSDMGSVATELQEIRDLYRALSDRRKYPDPVRAP